MDNLLPKSIRFPGFERVKCRKDHRVIKKVPQRSIFFVDCQGK